MGTCVEANSLSDITQIASNPPKYPRNPTEKQRQPLTLYIARVPGSQDIILTTLKPQLKNVTAEDVASSLYFLHLNTEDDALLLADEQDNDDFEEPSESSAASQKPLPRKPVSEAARSSVDVDNSGDSNLTRPAGQTAPDHLLRKPLPPIARSSLGLNNSIKSSNSGPSPVTPFLGVGEEIRRKAVDSRESSSQSSEQPKDTLQRRPLGPRPLTSESSIERKSMPGLENQPLNTRPQFQAAKISSDSAQSEASNFAIPRPNGSTKSFTITVIRRDLSSGAQWNVGSVVVQGQNREVKATSNSKNTYFDISLHLTTPGYTPFRSPQTMSPNDSLPQSYDRQAAVNESDAAAPDMGFDRQVRMEGSSLFSRASKQHKPSQSDFSDTGTATSWSSENPEFVMPAAGSGDSITGDFSSKGYVFLSPWGGRCKFSTGGGGRSLRCKHTLPESLSSKNAVFEHTGPATVSELRFNLPHAAMFNATAAVTNAKGGSAEPRRFSIPKFGHIRDKLSHGSRPPLLPPRPHPTSYATMYPSDDKEPPKLPPRVHTGKRVSNSSNEQGLRPVSTRSHPFGYTPKSPNEEDDERLDLSIGKEKAGGGNRGKRAKLGKLIIHNEGFKMLDLVVAANMGIWWSVYGVGYDQR